MKKVAWVLSFGLALVLIDSARGATLFVNLNNPNPSSPFSSWATAATRIQDAVDVASSGDLVLVTNGVYQTGGVSIAGGTTNRVVVTNAVTVRSVNGPAVTSIVGYQVSGTTIGADAIRCVYLSGGATLAGFTITNGATHDPSIDDDIIGAGVLCQSQSETISNCVISGNISRGIGGGVSSGTVDHCLITNNTSLLASGGGASDSILKSCLIVGNFASQGGGASQSTLHNCTVVGNVAIPGGGSGSGLVGGAANCNAFGSIIYYNEDTGGFPNIGFQGTNLFCCTTPMPAGICNFTNEPLFVNQGAGNFRLMTNSPCINSGANLYAPAGPDLDGNPRIVGGKVDCGVYELQNPASKVSYAWLQNNNFPIDGSADFVDTDADGMNNFKEWIAGTDPRDASSLLKMLPLQFGQEGGVILSWQSVVHRTYFVQRATNVTDFLTVASDIFSEGAVSGYTDFPPDGANPVFYRVWTDPERWVGP